MESAKAAVKSFVNKDGKHDTTVHESVNPHVTEEKVVPTQHEDHQKVVDRELHQHHHHTTVQPVFDKEVLPEKHVHENKATEHREFHHGNHDGIKDQLATTAAQFKDTRHVHDTQHTKSEAPIVGSEHHHHHIHETIQPVLHKETIQPTVVHTTQPIHETHHIAPKHHGTTTLPPVSLSELQSQGGHLGNHPARTDKFQGEPDLSNTSRTLGGHGAAGTTTLTHQDGPQSGAGLVGGHGSSTSGTGSGLPHHGTHSTVGTGVGTGAATGAGTGTGIGSHHGTHSTTGTGVGAGAGTTATTGTGVGSGHHHGTHSNIGTGTGTTSGVGTGTGTGTGSGAAFHPPQGESTGKNTGIGSSITGSHGTHSSTTGTGTHSNTGETHEKEGLISKIKHAVKGE